MRFLNLTPHPITIHHATGVIMLPVSGLAPRLAVEREELGVIALEVDGYCDGGSHVYDVEGMPWNVINIPIVRSKMGSPTGLPDQQDGTILVVSALVAEHPSLAARLDLAYPGEAIRDEAGKIVGCKGLCAGPGLAESLKNS